MQIGMPPLCITLTLVYERTASSIKMISKVIWPGLFKSLSKSFSGMNKSVLSKNKATGLGLKRLFSVEDQNAGYRKPDYETRELFRLDKVFKLDFTDQAAVSKYLAQFKAALTHPKYAFLESLKKLSTSSDYTRLAEEFKAMIGTLGESGIVS